MLVVDTNVLLRLILRDDAAQEARVRALFRKLENSGDKILLTQAVVMECLWVLESHRNKLSKPMISDLLDGILSMQVFRVEELARLRRALHFYSSHDVDFVDAYITGTSEEFGHTGVLSFDKDIGKMGLKWVRP